MKRPHSRNEPSFWKRPSTAPPFPVAPPVLLPVEPLPFRAAPLLFPAAPLPLAHIRLRLLPLLLATALVLPALLGGCGGDGQTTRATDGTAPSAGTTATGSSTPSAGTSATSGASAPTGSASSAATTAAATAASSATTPTATAALPSASTQRAAGPYRVGNAYPGLEFTQPLYFATAGDGSSDAFVVERTGRIRAFADRPGSSARTFLDLSNRIDLGGQEKGLLGLAFHPDYRNNGYFFVNYTTRDATIIARYTRRADSSTADSGSALTILTFAQPFANHNGGQLAFGPDGYLYIATGDGGSSGDPLNNAQNRGNLLGKILRIDVDRPSSGRAYGIPADNPFVGVPGAREEIYAYGLRNPWRFSFDAAGNLWAADVGQNRREEIDRIEKGGNYGWAVLEGTLDFKPVEGVERSGLKAPVWEYDRAQGISVTGGYVYAGSLLPDLQGTYIYGDFGSGRIWALWNEGAQVRNQLLLDSSLQISSFGLDAAGELRIIDFNGGIYRLERVPA